MKKILVICGATATGKTALAAGCAGLLGSEVISADSQLIYKQLNIGTAKPTEEEMMGVPHHMIDVVDPRQNFSVSDYRRLAKPIADSLIECGKIPVVCGGTGFYIKSLLFDYSYGNACGDAAVREKYDKILKDRGKEYLYGLLKQADAASAERIHPNDVKRVVRALEIFEVSGKKKSDISDGRNALYDYLAVAVDYPRAELYDRIDRRVDAMFESGLVDEVKALLAEGVDKNCQSMQAIGYKEVIDGLQNGYSQCTMRDIIKQNTRHYAKRQLTFFKKLPGIIWLNKEEARADAIVKLLDD